MYVYLDTSRTAPNKVIIDSEMTIDMVRILNSNFGTFIFSTLKKKLSSQVWHDSHWTHFDGASVSPLEKYEQIEE